MKKIRSKINILLLTLAFAVMASGSAYAGWTITDLSGQGDITTSSAYGINNNGQVVGQALFAGNIYSHAALWSNGFAQDLGTLGGTASQANAINDAGLVVGSSWTPTIGQGNHAALWTNGVVQDLGTLGGTDSSASAINNAGQVAGSAWTAGNAIRAAIWSNGVIQDLGTLGGSSGNARAINNAGQIAGLAKASDNLNHAVLWNNGVAQDLGTLGGAGGSSATAINDAGQVAIIVSGFDSHGSTSYVALLSNGSVQNLGSLGGTRSGVSDINNAGQVVGNSQTATGAYHAVLWNNGAVIDLNSLVDGTGWTLSYATGINDKGQIAGYGTNSKGKTAAFLLTPDAAPVPIPAALPLFGSGLAALGLLRRRYFNV